MRVGGGFQTVQGFGYDSHGTVEAEGHVRGAQIVVNGFRHAYDGQADFSEKKGCGLGAVTAYHDQGVQPQALDGGLRLFQNGRFDFPLLAHAHLDGEVPLVHGPQNGTALGAQTAAPGRGQPFKTVISFFGEKSFKPIVKTHDVPSTAGCRADNAFNDCVQAGTVPAAIQNTNIHMRCPL